GHHQLLDAAGLQDCVQIGSEKRALPWLVDHRFAGCGIEFGDDVVAGLAAHEDATHRARVPNASSAAAADFLRRREVGKSGAMALAGMDDQASDSAPSRQQCSVWFDGT